MEIISVKDKLPKNKTYVLAHYSRKNWGDEDKGQYWVVARFERGISKKQRESFPDTNLRKHQILATDEAYNNRKPYRWDMFGPGDLFGQDVDYWAPLPIIKKATI